MEAVNSRLSRGQGWIGYRTTNAGEPSKFLYFAFYRNGKQLSLNTKTNNPEEAYVQLLDARGKTERGVVLPSESSRIKYEHLRQKYIDDNPAREITQKSQFINLDKFFTGMKATSITTDVLRRYINQRRADGVSGPTIRRELTNLRAIFNLARKERTLSHDQVPHFPMPKDSLAAGKFIPPAVFHRILNFLPEGTERKIERRSHIGFQLATALHVSLRHGLPSRYCKEAPAQPCKRGRNFHRNPRSPDQDKPTADCDAERGPS